MFITLYKKAYAANWVFQPLGTGTAILVAAIITAACVGVGPARFLGALTSTWRQSRFAILTVALIVGLAYLMNYSGMNYTLGLGVASAGLFFPMLSAFLGWIAVFLSGSDTSGNALFGNLQVVAAKQLGLNPVLIAATNSSGGVMGKMISPQNIATGVVGHTSARPGRPGPCTHVHPQRHLDHSAGRARGSAAIRFCLDDPVTREGSANLSDQAPAACSFRATRPADSIALDAAREFGIPDPARRGHEPI